VSFSNCSSINRCVIHCNVHLAFIYIYIYQSLAGLPVEAIFRFLYNSEVNQSLVFGEPARLEPDWELLHMTPEYNVSRAFNLGLY
jgi:hypothetical protein